MEYIFYIFTLFVTFLHELGHVTAALLTGGSAHALQINPDGSGVATTSGGIRGIIEAGGYLGSIIFGNIILRLGIGKQTVARILVAVIGAVMIASSLIWFSTVQSFMFTMAVGIGFITLAKFLPFVSNAILVIIGSYSVWYALNDYNVGPSSDLQSFSGVIPPVVWMYIWLGIGIIITLINVYTAIKGSVKWIREKNSNRN